MSQRLERMLLKLYPARVRQRYGEDLLDLQAELKREGDLSVLRLIRDAIVGALIARSAAQRFIIIAGGVLISGAIAVGVSLTGSGTQPTGAPLGSLTRPAVARIAAAPGTRPAFPYGHSCFVGTGTSCSLQGCSHYASSASAHALATTATRARKQLGSSRTRAVCVTNTAPALPHPQTMYVTTLSPSDAVGS